MVAVTFTGPVGTILDLYLNENRQKQNSIFTFLFQIHVEMAIRKRPVIDVLSWATKSRGFSHNAEVYIWKTPQPHG